MYNSKFSLAFVAATSLALSSVGLAAPKSYQATGPILELTDASIVIQKGTEKWEFARGASTTVTGDLKVGAKVTVSYTMSATSIMAKDAKPPVKVVDKVLPKKPAKP